MIILHVTDFHFNKRWFDWLPDNAPAHDLLVMSGDMLNLSDPTIHKKQIHWVADWIRDYPSPISLCSGNHDLEWDSESELWTPAYWLRDLAGPTVWTDGQRLTLDGVSLLNISCTTRPKGGEADIWVAHAPPAGTLVATRVSGRNAGDPDLVGPVRRYTPRAVLSGHVHDPIHWFENKNSTLFLNPGRASDARIPNHILVDSQTLRCQFIAEDRRETLTLPSTDDSFLAVDEGNLVQMPA
jgi:Icc-related predicted phosphoesterase